MRPEEWRILFRDEVAQRREEGCDVTAFASLPLESLGAEALGALYRELGALPVAADSPYVEPSDLDAIRAERPAGSRQLAINLAPDALSDRVLGAWLGRVAGCLLGKPVEGWTRAAIEGLLAAAGKTELDDYCPAVDYPGPYGNYPAVPLNWKAGHIEHAPSDDDTNYTILALDTLERYGQEFTTDHIAAQWLSLLPYHRVCTAERVAYRNLTNGLAAPETATCLNPYREWIGAQIRADLWGYVNPGRPERAAEMAWRDARLSHVKNGIYGEMFMAATIAAAFAVSDVESAIAIGLAEIPSRSRLAEAVRLTLDWCHETSDWRVVWDKIQARYGALNWVHTINNAACVVMGLMLGASGAAAANPDAFGKAIGISVSCGMDTDCNGATTGSILGALLGAHRLAPRWTAPLDDKLDSDLTGLARLSLTDLARRTRALIHE